MNDDEKAEAARFAFEAGKIMGEATKLIDEATLEIQKLKNKNTALLHALWGIKALLPFRDPAGLTKQVIEITDQAILDNTKE